MDVKTIVAIGLVVFIIGALIFLKIRSRKNSDRGRPMQPPSLHTRKKIRRIRLWFTISILT